MQRTDVSRSMKEITDSLTNLFGQSMNTGMDVLKILSDASVNMTSKLNSQSKSLSLPKFRGCCEIPPPCWMPRELCSVSVHVCPGGTASLRFRITNCDMESRTFTVEADQDATVTPASLTLGKFERGWVTVSFGAPVTSGDGESKELLVFVHGCNSYYVRWTIQTSNHGCDCCHEIDIADCPDQIHHWYDHFYCPRPCRPQRQVRNK
jgi:hypothetical protein